MFSKYEQMYNGMAFSFSKTEHARRACLRDLEAVLFSYLDGREKVYGVRAALREAGAVFGMGAVLPAELIEKAILRPSDDERDRLRLVVLALDLLGKQLRNAVSIGDP